MPITNCTITYSFVNGFSKFRCLFHLELTRERDSGIKLRQFLSNQSLKCAKSCNNFFSSVRFFRENFTKTRLSQGGSTSQIQDLDTLYLTICPNFRLYMSKPKNAALFLNFVLNPSTPSLTLAARSGRMGCGIRGFSMDPISPDIWLSKEV